MALFDRPLGENEWIPISLEELLKQIQSAPPPTPLPRASAAWMTVPLAAALAGLAAGWQWFGFRMFAAAAVDPLPATTAMLALVALLAAGAGPWLPLAALPRLARRLSPRPPGGAGVSPALGTNESPVSGKPSTPTPNLPVSPSLPLSIPPSLRPSVPPSPPPPLSPSSSSWLHRVVCQRDEPLLWTVVAVLASAAGALSLLMLALATPFTRLYQHLLDHFFWTDAALAVLEWTGAIISTAPMCLLNSLVAAAIILAAARRWPLPQAGASVIIGGAIGWAVADVSHHVWTDASLSCEQQVLLGIVPMFLLAGLAVLMSHDAARSAADRQAPEADTPETGQGSRSMVWLALLIWAIASGLALSGWLAARDVLATWSGPPHAGDTSACPLLLAAGAIVGWLSARQRVPTGPGCGMALWAAGVGCGLAATLISRWPDSPAAFRSALLALPAGYALAYAQTAWLARAGWRALALAQMTAAVLGGLGIGISAGHRLALPWLGPVGTMATAGLVLLAFGGLAQIFARAQSGSTRYLRLGTIFASLAAAITIFPADVRQWSQTCSLRATPAGTSVDPAWLVTQAVPGAKLFCTIDAADATPQDAPPLMTLSFPFTPTPAEAATAGSRKVFPDACQALRQEHRLYDLVYQHGPLPAAGARYPGYSVEWLKNLARHRAPGGRVLLDAPLAGLNPAAAATIARTFQRAMGQPCVWRVVQTHGRPVLRLSTSSGLPDESSGPQVASTGLQADSTRLQADSAGLHNRPAASPACPWRPVESLLTGTGPISIHSQRRDAISRALHRPPDSKNAWPLSPTKSP